MNRRDALKTAGGLAGLSAIGSRYAAAHPGSYEPLGKLEISGAKEAVVNEDGTTAYVAATTGFATVDVTTPSHPELLAERRDLLAERENGPLQEIYDVTYEANRLVVVGPANPKRGEVVQGFLLYDVSDPANPKRLAFHETDFPIHNTFLRDGLVYLTGNDGDRNPLVVVDVRDDSPTEVSRWSILDHEPAWSEVGPFVRTLHDVFVQDGLAYLSMWDAGLWILDVSDPANPEYRTHFGGVPVETAVDGEDRGSARVVELPGNVHYAMPNRDGSLVVLNREAWDDPATDRVGGPGPVELWSVPEQGEPTRLSTIEAPASPDPTIGGVWTTSHNFDIHGDRLYTSWYQGGVKIHDISDPRNPTELAWWRDATKSAFWTAKLAKPTAGSGISSEGYFVASDMDPEGNGGHAALYTFGDEEGTQRNPPPLSAAAENTTEATTEATTRALSEATTEAAAGGGAYTATEAASKTTTAVAGGTTGNATTAREGQAGFGVLVALAALLLGAWRSATRKE